MAGKQLSNCVRASTILSFFSIWISVTAAFVVIPLGIYGFLSSCEGASSGFFAAVLQTFQLFVLNIGVGSLCNGFTWLAAFIAPIATLSALIAVFSHTVATHWRRMRLQRKAPDVVFLGGGKNATSIALQKYSKGNCANSEEKENVVFVDSSTTPLIHEHISRLRCNWCDWHGDALSGDVLQSTNTANAKRVWVLTGDDRRNIEITQNIVSASKKTGNIEQLVMANVDNQELVRDVSFSIGEHASVRFFSIKKVASRYLFSQFGPVLPFGKAAVDVDTKKLLHIAIVGSGDMVDALVEHAIVHFVYSDKPANCIQVTLIGNNATGRVAELRRRLPASSEYSDDEKMMELLPIVELSGFDCVPSRIKHAEWKNAQVNKRFDAVYVNDNIDLNTISWTTRVAALRELEGDNKNLMIVACLSQASYEDAALGQGAAEALPENIELFRMYDCICAEDSYPGESQDRDAMLINLAYHVSDVEVFKEMDLDAAIERAKEKWNGSTMDEALPEMFRRSSRLAADHIPIKLSSLYTELAGEKSEELFKKVLSYLDSAAWSSETVCSSSDELTKLMKLEHRRFVVERLVDGWLPTDPVASDNAEESKRRTKRNKALRLNETLVPYDKLPEDQKLKDRLIIECIPKILQIRK